MVCGAGWLHAASGAAVSSTAHALGLRVEGVYLQEVAGHQLLKPGVVSSPLHSARFHQSLSFVS